MTATRITRRGLRLVAGRGVDNSSAPPSHPVLGCYDCATCTRRAEFARPLGRSTGEVQRFGKRCGSCGHRLHRHLHGFLRSAGWVPEPDVFAVEAPPPDSALGRLRAGLAQDDGDLTS